MELTEQAAAKAVDLAAELCTAIPIEEDTEQAVVGRRLRVAAHLTYMAGLLRGLEKAIHPLTELQDEHEAKRAERQRDELLWAVDDVQRDPNVTLVQSVNHLVQTAGVIRHRLSTARVEQEARQRAEKALRDAQHQRDVWKESWTRIAKLVGREFTSPESVIDRVAWLVEQEHQRDGVVTELKELRRDHADLFRRCTTAEAQRDWLLAAARKVTREEDLHPGDDVLCELAEVVTRIGEA